MEVRRLAKQVRWVVINVLVVAGVWYGGFQGVEWAANLVLFYAWAMFVLALVSGPIMLIAGHIETDTDLNPHERQTIPSPVDLSVDVAVSLGMAATGWTVTAVVFLFHSCVMHFCLTVWKKTYTERKAKQTETVEV